MRTKTRLLAAALAVVAASVVGGSPLGAATRPAQDPCAQFQRRINQLELRLAHHGRNQAGAVRILREIARLRIEANLVGCHLGGGGLF